LIQITYKQITVKRLIIIPFILGFVFCAKAQSELTLPFMNDVFQSSYINPTVIPEHTISIGLPGMSSVYGQAVSNGFMLKNITYFKDDTTHINADKLLADLKDKNLIYAGSSVDLFHIRLKVRNGYYWIGARNNLNTSFQYPKDFLALAVKGNKPYLSKTLDLSNLNIDAALYNEYSIGMALEYNHWIIGGRISLLQGLSNIQLDNKSLYIHIDSSMYSETYHANARLNTSGIPKNSNGDISFDHVQELDYITDYLSNFKNKGLALSAGVTYKLNDQLKFSFSFYDLGFINWKDSVTNYNLKGNSGFSGIDLLHDYLNNEKIDQNAIIDSILDDFNRDTIQKSYRTYLHPKFNLSATYNVFRRTMVGFSAFGVYNKKLYPAFTLGVSQGIGRFFNILATVSYNQRTIRNLGVGLVINSGSSQFYIVTDNYYPAINPKYFTNTNVRVGINLVFGRVKPAVGLPYR